MNVLVKGLLDGGFLAGGRGNDWVARDEECSSRRDLSEARPNQRQARGQTLTRPWGRWGRGRGNGLSFQLNPSDRPPPQPAQTKASHHLPGERISIRDLIPKRNNLEFAAGHDQRFQKKPMVEGRRRRRPVCLRRDFGGETDRRAIRGAFPPRRICDGWSREGRGADAGLLGALIHSEDSTGCCLFEIGGVGARKGDWVSKTRPH